MKRQLSLALLLTITAFSSAQLNVFAQPASPGGNPNISMTIYPVVRQADGNQYLITPSGKQITVPGLVIASDATQVSVYRDQANHFWYTAMNGQQVAVTPEQLEAVQAQMIEPAAGAGMPPRTMPPAQSFYNTNPSYSGGYNGIPYGTPLNMEGPGQYSYMAQGGNKQFITPTPQMNGQFSQWQQQVPFGQQQQVGTMQNGQQQMQSASQQTQGPPQAQNSKQAQGNDQNESRMQRRRDHRADRLDNRAKNQASNSANDQSFATSKEQSGQTLGTGMDARRAAREERRSKREERRADRLDGSN